MITPLIPVPVSDGALGPIKRKRVLLVDISSPKRDLRADTMRKLGMEVDCATDIGEARSWWRADLYNLVIIGTEGRLELWDKFCQDVRGATPPQQLAFLVGKPEYLADSPGADGMHLSPYADEPAPGENGNGASRVASATPQQRWGIMEACQKISAVRSACDARVRATRNRPEPPRDTESHRFKRSAGEAQWLNEFPREEM